MGNGIGGRANGQLLADYEAIFYTCGDLGTNTLSNGDFDNDSGDDVGTLTAWLEQGDKNIFLTGDNLASDLAQAGMATLSFLEDKMGLTLYVPTISVRYIGNQTTPLVRPIRRQPRFRPSGLDSWIAFGGCPGINTFDGVQIINSGQRLAEFADPVRYRVYGIPRPP